MKKAKVLFFAGLRVLVFVVLFAVLLDAGSAVFMPEHGKREDSTIYYFSYGHRGEPRNSLDLVAVGNSDLYRGLSPIDLWSQYGIASCVSGQASQTTRQAYGLLKDVFLYQSPKVVVLEVDSLFSRTLKERRKAKKHPPFRKWAGKTVRSFKNGSLNDSIGSKLSHRFPIVKKHSNWTKLTLHDFNLRNGYHFIGKGYIPDARVNPYTRGFDYMKATSEVKPMTPEAEEYLKKIEELCKKKGAALVLLELPSASSWSYAKHNRVQQYAVEHALPFYDLNLNTDAFQFNWMTDTKDRGDHLNTCGAQKTTAYFGGMVKEKFDLPDRREDPAYRHWAEDEALFRQTEKTQAQQQKQSQKGVVPPDGNSSRQTEWQSGN